MTYNPAHQLLSRPIDNAIYDFASYANNTSWSTSPTGLNEDGTIAALAGGYDANGNEGNDGVRTFGYDVENRLTSAAVPATATTVALSYDPTGRLQQQQNTVSGIIRIPTQFVYAGDQLVAEYGSAAVTERYIPGSQSDETVVWYVGPSTSMKQWLYADHQGSVVGLSTPSGSVGTYQYGAYGEPSSWTGGRFRYTGQIALIELNLYHYKARVYDPGPGRFLQTDPVGTKDDLNLYAYVGSDPTDKTDPTGMCTLGLFGSDCKIWKSAASAVASVQAAIAPIFGKGQTSVNTPTHASTSERIANQEAQKPDTKEVHLNRNLQKITGDKGMPNQRPDVTTVKKDDTISRTEVRSSGQTTQELQDKLSGSRGALGGRAGTDTVVEPDVPAPGLTLPEGEVPVRIPEIVLPEIFIP